MSSPYVGEIILVGFNFAPAGWALCDGQMLPISENETLFQLIGTTYGGDGETSFAVPDLRGRIPIGVGQGPGTQNYVLGESGGTETIIPTIAQLGAHTHAIDTSTFTGAARCKNGPGNERSPVGNVHARRSGRRHDAVQQRRAGWGDERQPAGRQRVNHRRTRRRNRARTTTCSRF